MMKARIKKSGRDSTGIYFGQRGQGMSISIRHSIIEELKIPLFFTDFKGEIKKGLKPNGLVLGTPGKSTKSITFKKEEFKKKLAPERAKITEFNVDGQDYVRMLY